MSDIIFDEKNLAVNTRITYWGHFLIGVYPLLLKFRAGRVVKDKVFYVGTLLTPPKCSVKNATTQKLPTNNRLRDNRFSERNGYEQTVCRLARPGSKSWRS